MSASDETHAWWQSGIIYQIYPLSFQDSNGDGTGDLPGILQRLDYLDRLNVRALWLSPIFPSPMHDFGYDVADYCAIHPWFGTLADFDRLLAAVQARGMKLLLDLVPNHTSDEHPWFIASRRSREDPKRDWYLWRDPGPDGGPPNNWLSYFGGPAWTYDEPTAQYYLHQFTRQQPELNYANPAVLEAMLDCLRFWLDRGVDGFRVDVIWLLRKDPAFRDEPLNPDWDGVNPHGRLLHIHTANLPETHAIIRTMREFLDRYEDRVMVGETHLPESELMAYYGRSLDECHLPINFRLIDTDWQAGKIRALVERYEALLPRGAWPNWVLGNHDQRRLATRVGPQQLRVATMLLLTLRGTPTCYYGDELGMEDVPIPLERLRDPQALNQPALGEAASRDPARSPLPWDASPNAGFSSPEATPWLPIAADFRLRNVAAEEARPDSVLNFFRALTALRKREPALMSGDYRSVDCDIRDIYAYSRRQGQRRCLVVLNFGPDAHRIDLSGWDDMAELLLSTGMGRSGGTKLGDLLVGPNEGLLLRSVSV